MSWFRKASAAAKRTPLFQRLMLAQAGGLSPALAYFGGDPGSQVQAYFASPVARVMTVVGFAGGGLTGFVRGVAGRESKPPITYRDPDHRQSQAQAVTAADRIRNRTEVDVSGVRASYEALAAQRRDMGYSEASVQSQLAADYARLDEIVADAGVRAQQFLNNSEQRLSEFATPIWTPRGGRVANTVRAVTGLASAAGAYALTKDPELAAAGWAEGYAVAYAAEMGHNLGHRVGASVRQAVPGLGGKPRAQAVAESRKPRSTIRRGGFGIPAVR